ncbi:MAG: hypothetical protein AAFX01_07430 [Cyanobacteria bacterium J06638_28]
MTLFSNRLYSRGLFAQRRVQYLLVAGVVSSLVAACTVPKESPSPESEVPVIEQPSSPVPPALPPESVRDRVLIQAAQDLGAPREELILLRLNQEVWPDGCLGIGLPDEGCSLALVDGWQLEVQHNDQSWFYRTDATGDSVRQSYLDNNLPPSVGDRVRAVASTDSGIAIEQLQITEAIPQTWNGCLGIMQPDQACTEIAIPGWQVQVHSGDTILVYHTDMIGADIRLNESPNSNE